MPDYDPKSIPILDDIIDGESADAAETDDARSESTAIQTESAETSTTSSEISADEHSPDLFDPASFTADSEDPSPDGFHPDETETAESALIDYQTDKIESPDDNPAADPVAFSAQSLLLETIVDDIVKQLMPDLEQQLRFLVQQALEDKLPAEIIRQMSADDDKDTH